MIKYNFSFIGNTADSFMALHEKSGTMTEYDMINEAVVYYRSARKGLDSGYLIVAFDDVASTCRVLDMAAPAQPARAAPMFMTVSDECVTSLEQAFNSEQISERMTDALYLYDQICDTRNNEEIVALYSQDKNEIVQLPNRPLKHDPARMPVTHTTRPPQNRLN